MYGFEHSLEKGPLYSDWVAVLHMAPIYKYIYKYFIRKKKYIYKYYHGSPILWCGLCDGACDYVYTKPDILHVYGDGTPPLVPCISSPTPVCGPHLLPTCSFTHYIHSSL